MVKVGGCLFTDLLFTNMAKVKVVGTGSSGNSYILECENEILLIELGVNWNEIIKSLNYQEGFRKVVGCIASHEHHDHLLTNTVKKAKSRGVQIYSCEEAAEMYGIHKVEPKSTFKLGNFTIQSLPLKHNAECYGYIIRHPEFGKLLFATDCCEFRYKIRGLNHMLIECNYDEDYVLENAMEGHFSQSASENHLELKDSVAAIEANYSSSLENVILIHGSSSNLDNRKALREVKNGIPIDNVFVAKAGNVFELNKEEF